MTDRVALYVRVSTQEQAKEGYSITEQVDRLTKYCEAMRWSIYKVYSDPGFSGADTNRPGLQALLKDIKSDHIDKVLVYKLDRLSRSQKDTLNLIEDSFLKHDIDFISLSENFDTSTPFGRAMVGILAVFAQLEREQIKERMSMGLDARAKEGKYHGGPHAPVGYNYINGELMVNEYEAMIVREMFNLAADGLSPYKIADELNQRGLTLRSAWTDDYIRRVLRSKNYIGYIKHKDEWIKGRHESIITEDLFNLVQHLLDVKSEEHLKFNRRAGKANTYLGGYLYCAQCGAKYSKVKATKDKKYTWSYFVCCSRHKKSKALIKDPNCKNKNWTVDELTNIVFDEIRQLALDPDRIAEVKAPEDNRVELITKEIDKLDSQIAKLMDMYLMDDVPKDLLQEKLKNLNDKRHNLELEIESINKQLNDKLTVEQTLQIVQSFDDVLERGSFEEIRTVIGELIDKIELDNEDITIYWNI